MSRIAGLVRFTAARPSDRALADRMLAPLPGPDKKVLAAGSALFGRTAFAGGAIGGGLTLADGLLVCLDGRVLNHAELAAAEGLAAGDDAALIAALTRRYGFAGALSRLVGDFAVAVFDAAQGRLWLGRDRFGVKPLYWAPVADGITFASQPRALLALPELPKEVNRAFVARFAASHYRVFDNPREESPYAAIRQLPAAHGVELSAGSCPAPQAWWSLTEQPEFAESDAESLAERYRAQLLTAVGRRVKASSNPAFTLSGGLDSSSVLCCAAEITGEKQHAVSSVYADATFDERHEIQDVVVEKVSQWHPVELGDDIDLFGLIDRLVRTHDEPVATATWLSHLLVCDQVAADGFGALFGGLGGDELNAGEYEYFPLFFADLRAAGREDEVRHEVAEWARHHDHPIYHKDAAVAEDMMARLTDPAHLGRCLPDLGRMRRYYPTLNPSWHDLSGFLPVMDQPFTSYLRNRTYQDMIRETLPCCLRAEDRQCTAMGLEHHDPFLDHELVEFMYRVPATLKIKDGATKQLLRRAMRGILPEATRTRIKKTGWNAPAHRWFGGRTLEALRDRVSSAKFRDRGIYDPAAVMALIDDHLAVVNGDGTRENHMMFLWQLANVECWLDSIEGQG
ncbi:asparagine synthase-related protein [Magnetospirillum sp. 15-1]|uniref:asparagine synthetase B family protein n=1 Tax=Magnetospirillum sp. 15-1 TaxID=1979370 RepID=UPI000BBBF7B4|nr:asparagine synthase-related protein [Magnetospirillum sp. 15-1]